METFLIVDGNSLLYRAFYALPLLSNKKGEYSNAVYGFCNMFLKVIAENRPDKIVVAFDFGKKNFRHELFCDYKGTRKATPSELIPQFVLVKDLLKKMNVKVIEQSGIEADDILGTLAKSSDIKTIILSGDKDVLQLIDKNTEVWLTKRGISDIDIVTTKNIEEKFFLSPKQIVDYKAICGETSDNIPGVMGIGDKGALNLLKEFGSLENIYANIDKISGKLKDKLEAGKDSAFLSLKLATIKTDCEIGFNIEEYGYDYPFNRAVFDFFEQYDFRSLLKRQELFEEVFEPKQIENKIESETISIKDAKKLEAIIKCAKEEGQFAFSVSDGVCFSVSENVKYVIESELNLFNLEDNFKACILGLKPIFENEKIVKIFANYKAALYFLKSYDISVCGEVFDLTIMEYLLSSGGRQEEISCESNLFFALKDEKEEKLKQLNLWQLYKKIDLPLVNVLFTMENNGFKIDVEILDELSKKYLSELRALEKEIFEIAGEEFNINSPKQLSVILFDKLGIKCYGNKKKSTGIEVLNEIEGDHQIVSLIIKYRKVQKLNGTYIESYKKIVQSSGEIIHTVFNQTTTSTGRLSSSEPNLQNIPVRDDEGKNLRKLFVSRFENGKIISADYNQIELRLLADFSCDKRLIEDFNAKKDI
ncbi:MAG: DNA polymerase, partial [Clostridia bacterium]